MITPEATAKELLDDVIAAPKKGRRKLIALSGPPASGKSTLADALTAALNAAGHSAVVVPMDGFHLDNCLLSEMGMLERKGAPQTFDAEGLLRLVRDLPVAERVVFPIFDRSADLSRAGAGLVDARCDHVIIEGNYLLFDAPHWRDMAAFWDVSFRLNVPLDTLEKRLIARWQREGLSPDDAHRRTHNNDLKNARHILERALPASRTL